MLYRITNWDAFEHPTKSKRPVGGMTWFAHPASLTSKGRLRLLRMGPAGFEALVVFESVLSLHAERNIERRTGALDNSDGTPMEIEDIADAIRMPLESVERAFPILTSERIGWIEVHDGTGPGPDPVQTRTGPGSDPVEKGSLQDRTRQDSPPGPPAGGEGGEDAPRSGGEDGIPTDVLDAWDAHRGPMPEALRPPDPQTVRAWRKAGEPPPDEVARRTRAAAALPRYAAPSDGSPLSFARLWKAWALLGEVEEPATGPPPDREAARRAQEALAHATHLLGQGDAEGAQRPLSIALEHPATREEAEHLRELYSRGVGA